MIFTEALYGTHTFAIRPHLDVKISKGVRKPPSCPWEAALCQKSCAITLYRVPWPNGEKQEQFNVIGENPENYCHSTIYIHGI